MSLRVTAAAGEHDLLFLPWDIPLEEWPEDTIVALPRGISRHVVRFVRMSGVVYAVKETVEPIAQREYDLLFELGRRDVPCVDPVGIVAGRTDAAGEDLPAAIITRHLQFSLPYRALFSSTLRPDTIARLIDALAVLMVRLHLVGFFWGDCSLSNTLFRRDAGAFAAYLVDAETGEMHDRLSDGQRQYDLMTAETNVGGELLDVEASGRLHPSIDPIATSRAGARALRDAVARDHRTRSRSASASGTGSTRASAGSTTSASTSPSSPSCRRRAARRSA